MPSRGIRLHPRKIGGLRKKTEKLFRGFMKKAKFDEMSTTRVFTYCYSSWVSYIEAKHCTCLQKQFNAYSFAFSSYSILDVTGNKSFAVHFIESDKHNIL